MARVRCRRWSGVSGSLHQRARVPSEATRTHYYNHFIANFAKVAAPISNFLSSNYNFAWGAEEQAAFKLQKHKLTSAPVLVLPFFE